MIGLLFLTIFGFIYCVETSENSTLNNGSAPVLNNSLMINYYYKLPPRYNKFELPTKHDGRFRKINIDVGICIHNFRGIDEIKEEMTLELDLKLQWTDLVIRDFDNRTSDEIRYHNGVDYISVDSSFLSKIWSPDVIFNDLVSITKPSTHGISQSKPLRLHIYAGGVIQMYSRLIVKLSCAMNFQYYPADKQTCKIALRNYEFSNGVINLNWRHRNKTDDKQVEAFLMARKDDSFYVFLHDVNQTVVQYNQFSAEDNEDPYTILEVSISAKRKLNFHLMQTFLPSSFLVLITWLAFFMPINLLEARIGISMTTLLTLTSMFSSVKEYTPQVSYVKAIDIWMLACIISVFTALFEFCVLVWLRTETKKHSAARSGSLNTKRTFIGRVVSSMNRYKIDLTDEEQYGHEFRKDSTEQNKLLVYKRIMRTAEHYGFFILSFGFIGFNIVFWSWLLTASAYFNYDVDFNLNSKD